MTPRPALGTFVALMAACTIAGPPDDPDLTIHLDRTVFAPGTDTVLVTITLRNGTNEVRTFSGSSTCILGYEVRSLMGTLVLRAPTVCTDDLRMYSLAAGDSLVKSQPWFGQRFTATGIDGPLLEPGPYRMRAMLRATEGRRYGPSLDLQLLGGR